MILVRCDLCKDMFSVTPEIRQCECGRVGVVDINREVVEYTGPATMYHVSDLDLLNASFDRGKKIHMKSLPFGHKSLRRSGG